MKFGRTLILGLSLIAMSGALQAQNIDEALGFYHQNKDQQALALLRKLDGADAKMYQAEILMELDLDKAEDTIETATEAYPEHAGLHYWRGRIMGEQASNAIFSALGYAKKSLNSFKKAVALDPTEIEYLNGLMMFYLNAPSFVGGDEEKALALVDTLKTLDSEAGAIAHMRYISATVKKKTLEQLLAVMTAHPNHASIAFQLAQWQQRQENYEAAFDTYQLALTKLNDGEDELKCSIWYQQAKTTVLSKSEFAQGLQSIQQYMEQCKITRGMPGMDWAAFRNANILELNGDIEAAKRVYQSLATTADNELKQLVKNKV